MRRQQRQAHNPDHGGRGSEGAPGEGVGAVRGGGLTRGGAGGCNWRPLKIRCPNMRVHAQRRRALTCCPHTATTPPMRRFQRLLWLAPPEHRATPNSAREWGAARSLRWTPPVQHSPPPPPPPGRPLSNSRSLWRRRQPLERSKAVAVRATPTVRAACSAPQRATGGPPGGPRALGATALHPLKGERTGAESTERSPRVAGTGSRDCGRWRLAKGGLQPGMGGWVQPGMRWKGRDLRGGPRGG